jgi:D-aminopeptidase
MTTDGLVKASQLGVAGSRFAPGPHNDITDVPGVAVGHCTVTDPARPEIQTGVTVVLPHRGNVFREKVVASCHVINGFGKTIGLVQVAELGVLESPLALTNTLSVPAVAEGLLDHLLAANPEIGTTTGSVNVVVGECNDAYLNDLRGRHVTRAHVVEALAAARGGPVLQGSVGAGRGMSAFGLKGGIGTSSRAVALDDAAFSVGILVVSNFGRLDELVVAGCKVGRELALECAAANEEGPSRSAPGDIDAGPRGGSDAGLGGPVDAGSVMVVLATDAPLSDRQLLRCLKRVQNGIARTGATTDHGSGEVAIGFSTAQRILHVPARLTMPVAVLREDGQAMDRLFAAVTEATEEAILNSLFNAESVAARPGKSGGPRKLKGEPFPLERLGELMDAAAARDRTARGCES